MDSRGRKFGGLCQSVGTECCSPSPEIPWSWSLDPGVLQACRLGALGGNTQALDAYEKWMNNVADSLPTIHHYSWFDLPRKIRTYRDYWSRHWQSLYDIAQEDSAENNMFFQRPWSEVSDDDILELGNKLQDKMGGWVFHAPVDFSKPTPSFKLEAGHPLYITEWIKENEE